jgi:hypothetical protein
MVCSPYFRRIDILIGLEVAIGERLPLEQIPEPECSREDESEEDSESENEDSICPTELGQHMLTVVDFLADLYKLSFKIRNSATRPSTLKPMLHKEIDEDTNIDKLGEYTKYDFNHVFESFKQLQKDSAQKTTLNSSAGSKDGPKGMDLVKRLATTITSRRRVLRYWQKHAKKLGDTTDRSKTHFDMVTPLPQNPPNLEKSVVNMTISGPLQPAEPMPELSLKEKYYSPVRKLLPMIISLTSLSTHSQ